MIHPSLRWRFISQVEDRGYFEEEIVSHLSIEHRAHRVSFSDRFSADARASQAVREQARLAANCNSPALPFLYAVEEVKTSLTIIYELVEGIPLEDRMRAGQYARPAAWAEMVVKLVDEMLEARTCGARFDRLGSQHIVIVENDDLRFSHRCPVGDVSREQVEGSQFLARYASGTHGVYTSRSIPNELAELARLRDILLKAAASSLTADFETLRAEVLRAPEMYSSPLANVEKEVGDVLVRMATTSEPSAPISTLRELRQAASRLRRDEPKARPAAPGATLLPPPSLHPGSAAATVVAGSTSFRTPEPPRPTPTPRSLDMPPAAMAPSPASPSPSDTGTPRLAADTGPLPAPPPKAKAKPSKTSGVPRDFNPDEDLNPYSIPTGPVAVRDPASSSLPAAQALRVEVRRPPRDWKPLITKIVILLVIVGAIAGAAVFVLPLLTPSRPNTKPVAAIQPAQPQSIEMNQYIVFDATASTDAEGDKLTYQWDVEGAAESIIMSDPERTTGTATNSMLLTTPRIKVQFLSTGNYTVRLRTNDGSFFSEPVTVAVEVRPRLR